MVNEKRYYFQGEESVNEKAKGDGARYSEKRLFTSTRNQANFTVVK